ncbi:putative lipid II flippase FtsW [Leekyejoonella antrihumi]|uniref:Probable peptidoglycan glycosyltransferase FtsW n=1 Tax=Leekyejoonella antrihumi TaxID=1660198 RepID=A0A563DYA7_9MICO|nr:putative lipid II flippase FtsW [Leekyejoonella antrihumi]TWP35185.1 putative lipid II flippase FtsW [Leekyejoonella antrihumi]
MTAASTSRTDERWHLQDVRERLESPIAPYYLLLGSSTMLLLFGLIMVLSASSVTSYVDSGSSFTVFKSQAMFAVLGVIGAMIASRVPVRIWKILALPTFAVAILLELMVFTGLGRTVNGNRNWIGVGGFTFQPSELGKLAVVLVAGMVLAHKRALLGQLRHVLLPLAPLLGLLFGLVLLGHDLGTTMVLLTIAAAMFFVAGVRMRVFAGFGLLAFAGVMAAVVTSGNRTGRIDAWLGTCINANTTGCYQKVHGLYAMADGGWWGVGLGASREKWSWLPEAHNDFIFAIIGEELGLPGTLVVLALYLALGYACYRMIVNSSNMFVRLTTAGIMVWILAQAMINIGSVIGLLPIIGVPLPLVSSGGSALVTTLLALGILIAFARNEPECKAALAARPSLIRRTMAVLPTRKASR